MREAGLVQQVMGEGGAVEFNAFYLSCSRASITYYKMDSALNYLQ